MSQERTDKRLQSRYVTFLSLVIGTQELILLTVYMIHILICIHQIFYNNDQD